ncbi:hypothetical protein NDU88_005882 [Pleurodeles waltl]|uniref:Uncharacterized protein n=1 Tax=Pleurodeles waltl TaxID=8319 RepID=A0AAV7PNZ9_PLEWA|nr:hypothetical protein NDU88_005882 [Pleurodeles waltl]
MTPMQPCGGKASKTPRQAAIRAWTAQRKETCRLDVCLGKMDSSVNEVSQVEQKVSDLEDAHNGHETATNQIQSELGELQYKLDEAENRSRLSNLKFVGILEEAEATSMVSKVVTDLIYKCILPEKTAAYPDLTIRVPAVRSLHFRYPRTILVNFCDFRIKEQILSQAINIETFNAGGNFTFRGFSDMSIASA